MTNEEHERLPGSSVHERLGTCVGLHVRNADDDTIELPLTEEEMLPLSQAAEQPGARTSLRNSAWMAVDAFLRNLTVRSPTQRWLLRLAASLSAIGISVALGMVVAGRISTVTLSMPATHSAESLQPLVRFGNPFDDSEVFEFPPGTSVDEARQSVAALLMQRARERQAAGLVNPHRATPGTPADHARMARNSEPPPASTPR